MHIICAQTGQERFRTRSRTRAYRIWLLALLVPVVAAGGCRRKRAETPKRDARAATKSAEPAEGAFGREPVVLASLPAELPEPVPPPGTRGGSLKVHLESEPSHLDPLLEPDANVERVVSGLVYEPLIECTSSGYRPALAESWEVSSDGMRVVLHLRPGVRWHDGKAFGTMDVQATVEPLLRASNRFSFLRSELSDVAAIEIAADRVVRLKLKRPSDFVLRALCDVPILPDHLTRGLNLETAPINKAPVGTGPYRFAGWERGKRIKLAANRTSWGIQPSLDEISFEIEPDSVKALTRARRGDIHVLSRVLDVHYPDQVRPAALHGNTTLYRLTPERSSFLVLNQRRRPFDDIRFRRALALLWDREGFAADLHKGLVRPAMVDALGGAKLPALDRKAAQELLDAAGYRDSDADGVRESDGKPLRISILEPANARTVSVEVRAFTFELRRAGVLADVTRVEPAVLLGRLKSGEFDVAPMMWEGRADEDPAPLLAADGPFNYGAARSPVIDGLLERWRQAGSRSERAAVGQTIGAAILDEQPIVLLYRHDVPALISNQVHGIAARGNFIDLRRVWLSPP